MYRTRESSLDSDLSGLLDEIELSAADWTGFNPVQNTILRSVERRNQSTLVRLSLQRSDGTEAVIVKIPKAIAAPTTTDALRLVDPVRDHVLKSRLEFAALRAAQDHFSRLDDPRFGYAPALAHLDERGAIVVGEVAGPTLDANLRARTRRHEPASRAEMLRNTGGWVAQYHALSTPSMTERDGTADHLRAGLHQLVTTLGGLGCAKRLPPHLLAEIDEVVAHRVPRSFPTGLGHGDLAPRNIFVGDKCQVTIIDTLGRFQVPIHEDIAYLLAELATGSTRFSRRRLPTRRGELDALRTALLDGYEMSDDPTLWLFELRALLDKWRSLATRRRGASRSKVPKAAVDRLREFIVANEVERVYRRLLMPF